jgi:hypothetical protein
VLLASVLRAQGPAPWRVARLHALLGVSEDAGALAPVVARRRGPLRRLEGRPIAVRASVEADTLPDGLLEPFGGDAAAHVVAS